MLNRTKGGAMYTLEWSQVVVKPGNFFRGAN